MSWKGGAKQNEGLELHENGVTHILAQWSGTNPLMQLMAYPRKAKNKDSQWTFKRTQQLLLKAHQHHHDHQQSGRTCVSSRGGWVMDWAYRTLTVTIANLLGYGALSLSNWCSTKFQILSCARVLSDERKIAWWLMKTLIVVSHFTTLLAFSGYYPRLMSFHSADWSAAFIFGLLVKGGEYLIPPFLCALFVQNH